MLPRCLRHLFLLSFLPFSRYQSIVQGLLVPPFLEKTLEAVKGPFFEYRVSHRATLDNFALPSRQAASSPQGMATFIRSVKDFLVLVASCCSPSGRSPIFRLFIVLPISKRILLRRAGTQRNVRVGKSARTKFNSPGNVREDGRVES